MGVIIDCAVYRDGVRRDVDCRDDMRAAVEAANQPHDFVWIGLHEPDADELRRVAEVFGLHPLAVEDAVKAHQRPKLERYESDLFLVLKTLWYVEETDQVETGEINIFVGERYVVSVRHGTGAALAGARRDLEQKTAVLGHGPAAVLYAICDRVVDEYEEVAGELEVDVSEIEQTVFSTSRSGDAERINRITRAGLACGRAVAPLREPVNRFATGTAGLIPKESMPFFRDVHDHVLRVSEEVAALDDLLSNVLSAHLAALSLQQNDDMRKISAWVAMAAVPTLLAGIYGMNFDHMPELHWTFGYPLVIAVMATICAILYRLFKRSGWL